jgi:hypothetical protein
LENSFQHIRGHLLAIRDPSEGSIRAGMALYEVRSWLTGRRLVSVPFASVSDPLISEADQMSALLETSIDLLESQNCDHLEVRAHGATPLVLDERFQRDDSFKHHFLRLDATPAQLLKRFHRTCVRQRIQRALKSRLTLKIVDQIADIDHFHRLYVDTRKRLGLPAQPIRFFRSMWDFFYQSGNLSLMVASYQDEIVAALLLLKFRDQVSAEFEAYDSGFKYASPVHFVMWHAIRISHEEGYRTFDFGRTSVENTGLMQFKKRWATEVQDLPAFLYPADGLIQRSHLPGNWKRTLVERVVRGAPAPAMKYINEFCYRHLG